MTSREDEILRRYSKRQEMPTYPRVTEETIASLLILKAETHLREMREEIERAKHRLAELNETLRRIGVTDPEEIKKRRSRQLEIHRHNLEIMLFLIGEDRKIAEELKLANALVIRRLHDLEGLPILSEFDAWASTEIAR